MNKKIVVALGGNALGNDAFEQLALVQETAKSLVDLVEMGNEVIIAHGNGPQVGMINLAFECSKEHLNTTVMPFPECGAMSQGYIGYHLQQAINNELIKRKINKGCVTVVTQVVVDEKDKAFKAPTKPIGSFYTKEEALDLEKETGNKYVEDSGRGYRRVVPSPNPIEIVELDSVKTLSEGFVVITIGGGGIPVIKTKEGFKGIAAVIDKDKTSSKLAIDLNADILLILTAVPKVLLNFGTEDEIALDTITLKEVNKYIDDKEFAEGSMLPKIEACVEFVEKTKGRAIITSLDSAKEALEGQTGTQIINK